MQMTRHETTTDPVTGLLAELAGVTDRMVAALSDTAAQQQIRMATAGSLLASTDRLTAAVIEVLSQMTHRGVIADEGVSVGAWLRTFAARTTGDEKMLAACVERLADLPTVREWFASGELSWPVVRSIVLAVRSLTREQRRWVDATLADDRRWVAGLDPDRVVAAVDALADQARPDLHRQRERRAEQGDWVRMQDRLDGGVTGQFQFGAESADQFRRALAATTPPPDPHDHDDHPDGGADGDGHGHHDPGPTADSESTGETADADADADGDSLGRYDRWRRGREHRNAKALIALANQRLGAAGGTAPSAARPSLLIIADINTLTGKTDGVGSATAQLVTLSTRGPVELTHTAAQRLACDATWRIILTDGDHILGATAAHPKVSVTLRAALIARDGGCRFPACPQPAELCENHHLVPVEHGGPTALENLALICNAHHHAIHDSGWTNTPHTDGAITFTRRGVTITSTPRTRHRLRPTQPPPTGRPHGHHNGRVHPPPPTNPVNTDPTAVARNAVDPDPPPPDLPF